MLVNQRTRFQLYYASSIFKSYILRILRSLVLAVSIHCRIAHNLSIEFLSNKFQCLPSICINISLMHLLVIPLAAIRIRVITVALHLCAVGTYETRRARGEAVRSTGANLERKASVPAWVTHENDSANGSTCRRVDGGRSV